MINPVVRLRSQAQLAALKLAATLLPMPRPLTLIGKGSAGKLAETLADMGIRHPLIVTDRVLSQIGLIKPVQRRLTQLGITHRLFDAVTPDPTFDVVNQGLEALRSGQCDAVLAIGGGSSIDAGKVIALAARDSRDPRRLVGVLKARKRALPLFVIPTTAGTGSEVTVGAVISDSRNHQKGLVIDPRLVPVATALDPRLMLGMPAHVTAETGLDALTHALEAWCSDFANAETDGYAGAAARLIFQNLPQAVDNGQNLAAREAMALASHYAGLALNQAGLGYVHAIAHQLGAYYGLPHGKANAVVLPHVLDFNQNAASRRLAQLARHCQLASVEASDAEATRCLLQSVRDLIQQVGIDTRVPALQSTDFRKILRGAFAEAHGTYAVPRYMDQRQGETLLSALAAA